MNYSIHMNTVSNTEKNVKAYASVTFEDCFQVRNIAVVQSRDGVLFVSMPAFKSKERSGNNEVVYKDVCNPITSEFRSRLYEDIIGMYEELGIKKVKEMESYVKYPKELKFSVGVSLFERPHSNLQGLARIYLDDCFVINNVSILKGKESEFVAMPSYMARPAAGDTPARYQDVCYPVTKEFRDKLYGEIMDVYKKEKEKVAEMQRGSQVRKNYGHRSNQGGRSKTYSS